MADVHTYTVIIDFDRCGIFFRAGDSVEAVDTTESNEWTVWHVNGIWVGVAVVNVPKGYLKKG